MSVAQQPLHDTPDSDQDARRSLLAPAEIRSRPNITKASVWFLRTTSLCIPYRMADRPRLLLLLRSNIDKLGQPLRLEVGDASTGVAGHVSIRPRHATTEALARR